MMMKKLIVALAVVVASSAAVAANDFDPANGDQVKQTCFTVGEAAKIIEENRERGVTQETALEELQGTMRSEAQRSGIRWTVLQVYSHTYKSPMEASIDAAKACVRLMHQAAGSVTD